MKSWMSSYFGVSLSHTHKVPTRIVPELEQEEKEEKKKKTVEEIWLYR